jgi:DNA-binding transcriptional ArsR family regulator
MNIREQSVSPAESSIQSVDDTIWAALNDPSRRTILDLLRTGSMTTGKLCEHFETSRFAIMKHLKVLQQAGLVMVVRSGRERFNHLNPVPIQSIYRRWIRPFEQLPADRMIRLKHLAEQTKEKAP